MEINMEIYSTTFCAAQRDSAFNRHRSSSIVVPAHNEVKLLGLQWMNGAEGREAPNISHMPSHSHPGEASRANQTSQPHRPDLFISSSQPTQHYGPSQTNPLRQLRRDGNGRNDDIRPNCIIYIAKTIYIVLHFTIFYIFYK